MDIDAHFLRFKFRFFFCFTQTKLQYLRRTNDAIWFVRRQTSYATECRSAFALHNLPISEVLKVLRCVFFFLSLVFRAIFSTRLNTQETERLFSAIFGTCDQLIRHIHTK